MSRVNENALQYNLPTVVAKGVIAAQLPEKGSPRTAKATLV